jgi:type I restriction enzyme, S subunit
VTVVRTPFLEVIRDASGGNPKIPKRELLTDGDLPVVDQGKNLIAGFINDANKACKAALPVIVFGDHTRTVKYIDFPFAMGADGIKVLAARKPDRTDAKYLYYALSAIQIPSAGYSRHYKFLKECLIPFPPLAEQKRIAAILDAADASRAKRRESIEHLDRLIQSTFLEMFGDVSKEADEKGVPLGEAVTLQRGFDLPVQDRKTGHIKIYAANGVVGTHDLAKVTGPGVITGRSGSIGKVHFSCNDFWPLNTALWVKNFHRNEPRWVAELLTQIHVERFSRGVGVPTLNRNLVHEFRINVPPRSLQTRFTSIVESIEKQKAAQKAQLAELDHLFASLQHNAFNGTLWH